MPLILVIVADPHEAAQLATLIQGRLSVDLVQAAEVGEGLLALDDRIPDLILTSPLMSPFDDGVLDEYLRDLGPAGAHVQTLRIPVLSQAPKKTKRLGFSLRRSKPEAPTIDGCDPKVFTDEIEEYLARAVEEKRRAAQNDQPVVIERQVAAAAPEVAEEQWTAAYSEDEPVARASWSEPELEPEPEPEPETTAWRADLLDRAPVEETPIYQPSPVAYEESPVEYETPIQEEAVAPVYEPIAEPAIEPEPAIELVPAIDASPVIEAELTMETLVEPALEETQFEETPIEEAHIEEPYIEEPPAVAASRPAALPAVDENKASPSFKAALAAIRAAWGKQPRKSGAAVDVDLTGTVEVIDEEPVDINTSATPTHAPTDPVAESVDVYELSVEPEEPKPIESAPPPAVDSKGDGRKKGKRSAKQSKAAKPTEQPQAQPQAALPKAAQNEWGIFDPNQCGFAALVDKLDEVSDEKPERRQNGAKARVISLS